MCKGYLWQEGKTKKLQKSFLQEHIEQELNANFAAEKEQKSGTMLPAANLSPKDMKGEHWKDFPGYEGLHQISNKGRVKALGKVSEGKLKKWLPERIIMLSAGAEKNKQGNPKWSLKVTLSKGGKKRTHSVARYVYHLFVKEFDLSDANRKIYYKDDNAHNMNYRNLYLKEASWSIQKIRLKASVTNNGH